jgi:hypothetical protein
MSKTKKIILIASLVIVAAAAGWYGFKKYEQWSFWREMKLEADQFASEQNRLKSLIEADTYGGKTPQETLEMFIKAVEASDYELASKYFVVEKQEEEFERLKRSPRENINNILNLLKQVKNYSGEYSDDKKTYSFYNPIAVDFIKYPSNLWKINEI